MAMLPKLWSLSALSVELGRNIRTLGKCLRNTPPDGKLGKHDAWHMATVLAAWGKYEQASVQLNSRGNSRGSVAPDASLAQLEQLAHDIDAGMRRLRAAAPGQRLEVLADFGAKIGSLDRALERSVANQGLDATAALGAFRDRHVGRVVTEIRQLVQSAA